MSDKINTHHIDIETPPAAMSSDYLLANTITRAVSGMSYGKNYRELTKRLEAADPARLRALEAVVEAAKNIDTCVDPIGGASLDLACSDPDCRWQLINNKKPFYMTHEPACLFVKLSTVMDNLDALEALAELEAVE